MADAQDLQLRFGRFLGIVANPPPVADTRKMVAEMCDRHGITLAPETPVAIEHLGGTRFAYAGESPYSLIARREDRKGETILYVSAGLLSA